MSRNNLSGGLPDEWGAPNSFPRLRVLYLQHNGLSGPLPAHWAFHATLQQLFSWWAGAVACLGGVKWVARSRCCACCGGMPGGWLAGQASLACPSPRPAAAPPPR